MYARKREHLQREKVLKSDEVRKDKLLKNPKITREKEGILNIA